MAAGKHFENKIDEHTWKVWKKLKSGEIEGERLVTDPFEIWIIGNTGMRNPWRIPGGFKVYAESNMVGRIRTPEDQKAFKKLLAEKGEIGGDPNKDADASITRKYRLMFSTFGFTYPQLKGEDKAQQENLLGPLDGITPAGYRFLEAENVISAQQECFLRGLVVPMEPIDDTTSFSPLLWTLSIMLKLHERTSDYKINYIEFATWVQTTNPSYNVDTIVDEILMVREARKDAENKKRFDRELIHSRWEHYKLEEQNFRDYADMNMRYITISGMVKKAGRGITLVEEYRSMAIELCKNTTSTAPLIERYNVLCNGAPLPTDNIDTAQQVLNDLIGELDANHIHYEIPDIPLDNVKNVDVVRKILKQDIDQFKEEKYAERQRNEWEEIYEYMQLIVANNGREKDLGDDNVIKVPTSEAAAYLEWVLWRSFLAIDHTVNKPYEARGFNIDQDYMPVGTAPGGMPDMYFEFEDYVIVVEVTMSTNSRQEAMEGEPVRRHVADYVERYNKPVYGIFVANKIDSNTAETFRIGVWYNKNDEKMALKIVPYTLKDYAEYFRNVFQKNIAKPESVISLFEECFKAKEGREAPSWKQEISNIVLSRCSE